MAAATRCQVRDHGGKQFSNGAYQISPAPCEQSNGKHRHAAIAATSSRNKKTFPSSARSASKLAIATIGCDMFTWPDEHACDRQLLSRLVRAAVLTSPPEAPPYPACTDSAQASTEAEVVGEQLHSPSSQWTTAAGTSLRRGDERHGPATDHDSTRSPPVPPQGAATAKP